MFSRVPFVCKPRLLRCYRTGSESIMAPKKHGSCSKGAVGSLRWNIPADLANNICCFNRHFAEPSGYFKNSAWLTQVDRSNPTKYFDPIHGRLVFTSPIDRNFIQFLTESENHGWPSFRDVEVEWDNVRVLPDGEVVTIDGAHLGHNIPDGIGNRYCINLVSISGNPST